MKFLESNNEFLLAATKSRMTAMAMEVLKEAKLELLIEKRT